MKEKIKVLFFDSLKLSVPLGILLAGLLLFGEVILNGFFKYGLLDYKFVGIRPQNVLHALIFFAVVIAICFLGFLFRYGVYGDPQPLAVIKPSSVTGPSTRKREAQNTKPPKEYLSDTPKGLVVGRYDGLYVRLPFKPSPEHQIMLGGSGTGKTQLILTALIWLFNYFFHGIPRPVKAVLAIDSKPELTRKSIDESRGDVRIVSFDRKDRWGFNVWFGLSKRSTDDELDERATSIARSLIPDLSADNRHFSVSGQKILAAFLMYGFRKGLNFSESIHEVNSYMLDDYIAEILSDPDMTNHPQITDKIRPFEGNSSDEFHSIISTMTENLSIFERDGVSWCFGDNPDKATPVDLTRGISVFLSVPDYLLSQYRFVFGMVMELCLSYLMSRPEKSKLNDPTYWALIDEGGTIYIPSLMDVVTRGRSKGIQLTLIAQDVPELEVLYGKEQALSLLNNCRTKIVLSCSDPKTASMISGWCGNYREDKATKAANGTSVSTEYRPVMDASDLYGLESTNNALVLVRGTWFLCEKAPMYSIWELYEKSDEIVQINENYYN